MIPLILLSWLTVSASTSAHILSASNRSKFNRRGTERISLFPSKTFPCRVGIRHENSMPLLRCSLFTVTMALACKFETSTYRSRHDSNSPANQYCGPFATVLASIIAFTYTSFQFSLFLRFLVFWEIQLSIPTKLSLKQFCLNFFISHQSEHFLFNYLPLYVWRPRKSSKELKSAVVSWKHKLLRFMKLSWPMAAEIVLIP